MEKSGTLTLDSVENHEAEEKVLEYLGRFFGNVPPAWIGLLVKRTPALLIDDIPANEAARLIADLNKLGATATFTPNTDDNGTGDANVEQSPQPAVSRKSPPEQWSQIYGVIFLILLAGIAIYFIFLDRPDSSSTPSRPGITAPVKPF